MKALSAIILSIIGLFGIAQAALAISNGHIVSPNDSVKSVKTLWARVPIKRPAFITMHLALNFASRTPRIFRNPENKTGYTIARCRL
jgi:hypothetical protein